MPRLSTRKPDLLIDQGSLIVDRSFITPNMLRVRMHGIEQSVPDNVDLTPVNPAFSAGRYESRPIILTSSTPATVA
jgi:hypothetical protein